TRVRLLFPSPRQDTADSLAAPIEPVSRPFTLLDPSGVIALPNARRVVVRDASALTDSYSPAVSGPSGFPHMREASPRRRFTGISAVPSNDRHVGDAR